MATSVIPAFIDAVLTAARAGLPGVDVFDGFGVSDDPGDYLMVGVDDPERQDAAFSADSVQSWAHANRTARDEVGAVTCAATSWNGDGDQKAARDAAFATTGAVETFLRVDPTMGDTVLWCEYGSSTQLTQAQGEAGALALVVFRIHFRARI